MLSFPPLVLNGDFFFFLDEDGIFSECPSQSLDFVSGKNSKEVTDKQLSINPVV